MEYAGMAEHKGIKVFRLRGLFAILILPIAFLSSLPVVYMAFALILISMFLAALPNPHTELERLGFTILGVFYIAVCFTAPLLIRLMPEGEKLVLLICFGVWGADTGAYYIGSAVGKRKLVPELSPGKTVEGLVGGVFSSLILCFLFAQFFFNNADVATIVAAGLIASLIGPFGDISESMMKRFFGVKDSGTILPGHGGLLDRMDALMFSLPVFYVFLELRGVLS